MVDEIEMSLDEIIVHNKQFNYPSKRRRGRHPRRRANSPHPGRDGTVKAVRGGGVQKRRIHIDPFVKVPSLPRYGGDFNRRLDLSGNPFGQRPTTPVAVGAWKLLISNLDLNVSNSDIKELFAEFGPLISSAVHYNESGMSLGTAEVVFVHKVNAMISMRQYNGIPLDGRPMIIQLAALELPSYKKPAPREDIQNEPRRVIPTRRGRRRKSGAVAPSAQQLDAELDAYVRQRKPKL